MTTDLVDDAEWQRMLAEFNMHFWSIRAPAFLQAWGDSVALPAEQWTEELKRSVHGLAGVAALVGEDALGDLARDIERRWDNNGGASSALSPDLQSLADKLLAAKVAHENG